MLTLNNDKLTNVIPPIRTHALNVIQKGPNKDLVYLNLTSIHPRVT